MTWLKIFNHQHKHLPFWSKHCSHICDLAGISQSVQRLGCGLEDQRIFRFPAGAKDFFYTVSRPVFGSTKLSVQCVLGAHSPGVKWLRCDADHPSPSAAEVETVWSCASTPTVSSWLGACLSTYSLVLHVATFLSVIVHHKGKNWSTLIVIVSGAAQQGQKDPAECPTAEGSCPYFQYCYETVFPEHCPPT
jgi:hypothetical protein